MGPQLKCLLITRYDAYDNFLSLLYLWDCLIAWHHTFCLHCANGSSLLACQETHTHTQLNNKRYFNWADYTRYMEWYLCQSEQGALVHRFHWNTRNMSSHFSPSNSYFIYANICQLQWYVWACVWAWQGWIFAVLCKATIWNAQRDLLCWLCCWQ